MVSRQADACPLETMEREQSGEKMERVMERICDFCFPIWLAEWRSASLGAAGGPPIQQMALHLPSGECWTTLEEARSRF